MALAVVMASVAISACAGTLPPVPSAPSVAAQPARYVYACPDGYHFSAHFQGDSAVVGLMARTVVLPQVASASGARYEAESILLRTKGEGARLEVGGTVYDECAGTGVDDPWEESRLMGATFRAIGQEPGWSVEIYPTRALRFSGDYGRTLVVTPLPDPQFDSTGAVTYHARTEAHELRVTLVETPCRDAMSGTGFSHSATVHLDGREMQGCGRELTDGAAGKPAASSSNWAFTAEG